MKLLKTLVLALGIVSVTTGVMAQSRSSMQTYTNSFIKQNGQGAITGPVMNTLLNQMIATMGIQGDTNTWSGANTFNGSILFSPPLAITNGGCGAATATQCRINLGAPGLTGTTALGNLVIGDGTGSGIEDSGNQLIKTGVAARVPTVNDDSTQGYVPGSIFVNTASGALYAASSVAPGAALWTQATPTTYFSYQSIGWMLGFLTPGASVYTAPGPANSTTSTVNTNVQSLLAISGTMTSLYVRFSAAPDAGQTYTITVYTGNPTGALTLSSLTCTIADTNTTCNDTNPAHAITITAGDAFSVHIVASGGSHSPNSGLGSIALGLKY